MKLLENLPVARITSSLSQKEIVFLDSCAKQQKIFILACLLTAQCLQRERKTAIQPLNICPYFKKEEFEKS